MLTKYTKVWSITCNGVAVTAKVAFPEAPDTELVKDTYRTLTSLLYKREVSNWSKVSCVKLVHDKVIEYLNERDVAWLEFELGFNSYTVTSTKLERIQ